MRQHKHFWLRARARLTVALLFGLVLLAAATPVRAAIGFDAASRAATTTTGLSDVAGSVSLVSTNIFVNSGANSITTPPATWVPPYSYPVDPAANVPSVVQQGAGVGKVTF